MNRKGRKFKIDLGESGNKENDKVQAMPADQAFKSLNEWQSTISLNSKEKKKALSNL